MTDASPFHPGEQEVQARAGKRDEMEHFGRRVIRPFMPDQHREFFAQLPFLVVGSVDEKGWPWASILSGRPGFLSTPDPTTMQVNALATIGDPLESSLTPGAPLGLLGIETTTRRRNRMNGRVAEIGSSGFALTVDQSFGNCPQYIQTRTVDFIREPNAPAGPGNSAHFDTLDDSARELISSADTFFVSSYVKTQDQPKIEGVDVSHRGGRPGFVKIEGNTLTIPDYPGNFHFNTLGNFLVNPKAGLVFADFETGELLLLTGTVELLWEDEREVIAFKGAERAWRFTLDHGVRLNDALPFRLAFEEYSVNTLLTGDWVETDATLAAEAKRDAWRPYRVTGVEDDSSVIRSFYLEPNDDDGLPAFEAGQFLTIRVSPSGTTQPVIRTYTTSSPPGHPHYRISVKREPDGVVSNYLHDNLKLGETIEAKAPRGEFFIDTAETRPAVLMAGGVGITPMISMALHVASEGVRTRHTRPLTVFHSAQTTEQRAFGDAFRKLEQQTNGTIRYYSLVDRPLDNQKAGVDFNATGYITADMLRQALALDDYDFYLCGPPPFMQALYDSLRSLGVRDVRIFAEAFGPASLTRQPDAHVTPDTTIQEADESIVVFAKSGFEQRWNAGDATILETAESHGLAPDFSCRNGVCGTCAVKIKAGSVAYRTEPTATCADDEALICCAVPATGVDTLEVDL